MGIYEFWTKAPGRGSGTFILLTCISVLCFQKLTRVDSK